MKKLAFIGLAIIVSLITAIYIFIPDQLRVRQTTSITAPESALTKYLIYDAGWNKWWPVNTTSTQKIFTYKGVNYEFTKSTLSAVQVRIKAGDLITESTINFGMTGTNLAGVNWSFSTTSGLNPIEKIKQYQNAKAVRENMGEVLKALKSFLENEKNLYGIDIQYSKVKDSVLLATHKIFKSYPETSEVYGIISKLRDYAIKNGAKENDYPMLNITQLENKDYQMMVAIPLNKPVPTKGNIVINKMVLGNILVTEVKGGKNTIENAFIQLSNYIRDKRHSSPAIPFESLVTNRIAEPDTTKWITKIYYPIF